MQTHADNMGVDAGFDALDYRYADGQGAARHPAIHGERDLWCAVIAQAFIDIGVIPPPASARPRVCAGQQFDEALRWLLRDKKDFDLICDLAGVSPQVIRHAAQVFYARCQRALGALHAQEE